MRSPTSRWLTAPFMRQLAALAVAGAAASCGSSHSRQGEHASAGGIPPSVGETAAAHLRTDRSNLDIYPLAVGEGTQGVYRVFDKRRKGDGTLFIETGDRVLSPQDSGWGFDAACAASRLLSRVRQEAALTAELYIAFSKGANEDGMVITSPERFNAALNTKEIAKPSASSEGSGVLLDFWTRNIDTDRVQHFKVYIDDDCRGVLRERKALPGN